MDHTWTIIGTGLVLAALNVGLFAWLRGDLNALAVHAGGDCRGRAGQMNDN